MKNVMTIAWEIAKEGQSKFGGNVKEYFSAALKMAWNKIKEGVVKLTKNFGFIEHAKKQGVLYFLVDHIEEMEVTFLSKSESKGREIIKRNPLPCKKVGFNKAENKEMRLYDISLGNYAVEIKVGEEKATFEINNGLLNWI